MFLSLASRVHLAREVCAQQQDGKIRVGIHATHQSEVQHHCSLFPVAGHVAVAFVARPVVVMDVCIAGLTCAVLHAGEGESNATSRNLDVRDKCCTRHDPFIRTK